ncbi:hypothetical protein F506_20260 [Herbaspirillum hiltneri N3]|uniref:HEPN domain-containing protein n=1 Tax=Herbaspirillum hiltneri N3 TaxID=1262470 RepID=A0ABM5V5A1_9BURK|nr:hypothetical protein F506_20260 [Herbaspirillum hiltneri N3]
MLNLNEKRQKESKKILWEELRHVANHERLAADPDGFVAKSARYYQAAMIGAAHKNLRILARLVVGHKSHPGFSADDFLSFAGVIESLRGEELDVLAAFIKERQRRELLKAIDLNSNYWPQIQSSLIHFSPDELTAIASGLTRTGFIVAMPGLDGSSWNVTPILLRLEQTVQFNDAIKISREENG